MEDPKTPAQRLARVFRILAVLAERSFCNAEARYAARDAMDALDRVNSPGRMRDWLLDAAEQHATAACRAAGIKPETIQ